MRGLSLVAPSGAHSSSRCAGLSPSRPLLLRSTGSRRAGSVAAAHGPSCSAACGIFPDRGSNPCPLHWQADSQPLRHQGSLACRLLFAACGIWFPGQGSNPGPLHWEHRVLTTGPPVKSWCQHSYPGKLALGSPWPWGPRRKRFHKFCIPSGFDIEQGSPSS